MHPQLLPLFLGLALAAPHLGPRDGGCGVKITSITPTTVTVLSPTQTINIGGSGERACSGASHPAIPTNVPETQPLAPGEASETNSGLTSWFPETVLPNDMPTATLAVSRTDSPSLPTPATHSGIQAEEESSLLLPPNPTAAEESQSPSSAAPTNINTAPSSVPPAGSGQNNSFENETPVATQTDASSAGPRQTSQAAPSQSAVQVSSSTSSYVAGSLSFTNMMIAFMVMVIRGFFID